MQLDIKNANVEFASRLLILGIQSKPITVAIPYFDPSCTKPSFTTMKAVERTLRILETSLLSKIRTNVIFHCPDPALVNFMTRAWGYGLKANEEKETNLHELNVAIRRTEDTFHPRSFTFRKTAKGNPWGKYAAKLAKDAGRGAQQHIQLDNITWSDAGLRRIAVEFPAL